MILILGEIPNRLSKLYLQRQNLFQNDVSFIASLHDIGKITPAFQRKLKDVINNLTDKALGSHHGILRRTPLVKISSNAEILGDPACQRPEKVSTKRLNNERRLYIVNRQPWCNKDSKDSEPGRAFDFASGKVDTLPTFESTHSCKICFVIYRGFDLSKRIQ